MASSRSCRLSALVVIALCIGLCLGGNEDKQEPLQTPSSSEGVDRPNIVFILSDDQDLHMDSLSYMPHLQKHLIDEGTFFRRHFCTVALCCPSRATLWTGREAHNTNVTDVNPPYGGYPKFVSQGFNDAYLPLWLQNAGYNTYYTGKLFNAHSVINYDRPYPRGWTGSDYLLDPFTYEYLNATFQRNQDPPVSYEGNYSTDVLLGKAMGFLDDALAEDKPFFLTIAPTAPHSNVNIRDNIIDNFTEHSVTQSPPIPAKRHKHLFADTIVPRTPHFNPSTPNSVSWISRLPHQNDTVLAANDHWYRSRLRTLQPIDEFIPSLLDRLSSAGVLDNTYIIYSTDNGYHIGQHRLQPGKQCAFEEDINIPFVVRGPRVPKGLRSGVVSSHVDFAPTILDLAGVEAREEWKLDGRAIPLTESDLEAAESGMGKKGKGWKEHVNVESWGIIMSEGKYGAVLYPNHTYKALRVVGEGYSLLYTVWCSGEKELYDVEADPYQLTNLHPTSNASSSADHILHFPLPSPTSSSSSSLSTTPITISRLLPRLNALLTVLKTCVATQCTDPWRELHPDGSVQDLSGALARGFDEFYERQDPMEFTRCERGYIRESERPLLGVRPWGMGGGMELEVDVGAASAVAGREEGVGNEAEGEGWEGWAERTEL
ncbi:uncharacterized protein HMPREF1541_04861 [Cyphellophora europaea CBS 101466]|uniref:Sulfatase N-terminal domain-containing protein n=1 Tax=Cyphellophora europaea (strain CBS 101466) TaxID=1220924 RepID=W2RY32_CYPE1|nr:uncharacterized protein HMPREF1541_04861 [Cyphellophora europaea CBS 101466]ETN40584.1 hypothetical protein HMPREF1541_04861 [Cyphellophora europaea CBS 101466]